ncbi:DMT family transporter [Fictibacillus barbaricus]|uniref:Drug/metabolite transporter (DMT)-like permease n=1 Tax=Fictibacillus barbaricus TaxID=182136 RepID=A0ABU1TY06_9BACL|nr:DMT family transporter [Fictibacillus barbaricus]MDR7072081.1 drug/metabolite transporter (DMT)-like permease [Fictibacillus barbaricus]
MKLYSALFTLSLIWGMSFLFIKVLLEVFDPWQIVFIRCVLGALTILPIILLRRQKIKVKVLPLKSLFLVGLLNAGIPWGLIALSETFLDSGYTAILNATTPIWTAMMGVLFFSVKMKWKQWIGVFVGFVGIIFLMGANTPGLSKSEFLIGILFMLSATCCYGFSSQYAKKHLQQTSVWITALATLLVGSIISAMIMSFTGGWHLPVHEVTHKAVLSLLGLGIFGSGLAYLLFYYMISAGSAEFAALVTYLVPVSAVIWGSVLLNEKIPPIAFLGLFLIFLGVYLTGRKKSARSASMEHNRTA